MGDELTQSEFINGLPVRYCEERFSNEMQLSQPHTNPKRGGRTLRWQRAYSESLWSCNDGDRLTPVTM